MQLKVQGCTTLTCPVINFIKSATHNLSEGFGLFVSFGLDYSLQPQMTSDIPEKLEKSVSRLLEESRFSDCVKKLRVEFAEAGTSSLNLMIIALFNGKAADDYYPLRRFLQRAAVDACNEHGWVIPFNQITVHMDKK